MLTRVRQGVTCMFAKYEAEKYSELVGGILSEEELEIFNSMEDYDKIHSVRLLLMVQQDLFLSQDPLYLKLALLHDCGKGNASLGKRVKKVLVGDAELEDHPYRGYLKLKDINPKLAELCKKHHDITAYSIKMSTFQKLDDM